MGDAPQGDNHGIIIRRRSAEGSIDHSRRIDHLAWKHKKTGIEVKVTGYRRVMGVINEMRVIFFDPLVKLEFSMEEEKFKEEYEALPNLTSRI